MTSSSGEKAATKPGALALVGFMGVGKSSIGRLAASQLGLPFIDCDALIVARHGPIPEIFATHGEQTFRELERDEVCKALEAARSHPCVVALGGGAVLSGDVREALWRLPRVVWLTAAADVLWRRVQEAGAEGRPLAADEQRFRRLLEERSALYASVATESVATDRTASAAAAAGEVARLAWLPSRHRTSPSGQGS